MMQRCQPSISAPPTLFAARAALHININDSDCPIHISWFMVTNPIIIGYNLIAFTSNKFWSYTYSFEPDFRWCVDCSKVHWAYKTTS